MATNDRTVEEPLNQQARQGWELKQEAYSRVTMFLILEKMDDETPSTLPLGHNACIKT
jgi:hypothetical protein